MFHVNIYVLYHIHVYYIIYICISYSYTKILCNQIYIINMYYIIIYLFGENAITKLQGPLSWSFCTKKRPSKMLSMNTLPQRLAVMTGSAVASIHPSKINIEPENDGLEDDFPLPGVYIYTHILKWTMLLFRGICIFWSESELQSFSKNSSSLPFGPWSIRLLNHISTYCFSMVFNCMEPVGASAINKLHIININK